MSEGTKSAKKRKYIDQSGNSGKNNKRKWAFASRPKRGAPGVLLTCETGREVKCRREGLEILNYYHTASVDRDDGDKKSIHEDDDTNDKRAVLSLEEELKLLKSSQNKGSSRASSSAFGVYDTSCRGTIYVLCTLPNSHLIPSIQTEYMRAKTGTPTATNTQKSETSSDEPQDKNSTPEADEHRSENPKGPPQSSKTKVSNSNIAQSNLQETPPWDPIATVRRIMSDIDHDSNKEAPRSRFVTRMIPIQATCFASPEELQLTSVEVLKRYISKSIKTFAIAFKRRNCSNLDRTKAIEIIGNAMSELFPDCKVQLGKPDATIVVEVCGTLCGISVIEKCHDYRNFNLIGATPAST